VTFLGPEKLKNGNETFRNGLKNVGRPGALKSSYCKLLAVHGWIKIRSRSLFKNEITVDYANPGISRSKIMGSKFWHQNIALKKSIFFQVKNMAARKKTNAI
jgi:hypothetical protein